MSKIIKKTVVVTKNKYTAILDALEFFESRISAKLTKTVDLKKRKNLKDQLYTVQELLIDLADDDSDSDTDDL